MGAVSEDAFGPLEVGADYASSFFKINVQPFRSDDHGGRWVNTYVNDVGKAALFAGRGAFPIGSVVLKESFEDAGGAPSEVRGPIFVMEKHAAGYDSARGDWWWAIHWEHPTGALGKNLGGPIYWRGKSKRVSYCNDCHKKWSAQDFVAVGIPPDNLNAPSTSGQAAEVQDAGDVDF